MPRIISYLLFNFLFTEKEKLDDGGGDEEVVELTPDLTEVDLTHSRIKCIEGFDILERVEFLGLRNNLIKKIENLDRLTTLKELELYDNQITKIENLDALVNLE